MKTKEDLKKFRGLSAAQVKEELLTVRREMMNVNMKHMGRQLQDTAQLRKLRQKIAQLRTVLAQQSQA